MSNYTEVLLQEPTVPLPAAYSRQVSYDVSKNRPHNPNVYNWDKRDTTLSATTEIDSLKVDDKNDGKDMTSTGKHQKSVLIFIRDSRIYIRVLAILTMIVSLSLILTAVISFLSAQNKPGHPLDSVPKPTKITVHPCIVFSGVAAMNLVFSIAILSLSCISSKFRKSNDAVNASFAIISAVGFASSMGACFFLKKENTLQVDLWKWSCDNQKHGISSDALDFSLVCNVVNYGWKFGLVQASFELLTFFVSVTAFILLKYSYFVRYGAIGKVF